MANDNDAKLAAAKAALSSANAFTLSVNKQAGVPQSGAGHGIGQSFAQEHGRNHQGMTSLPVQTSNEAESIREGIQYRIKQREALPKDNE